MIVVVFVDQIAIDTGGNFTAGAVNSGGKVAAAGVTALNVNLGEGVTHRLNMELHLQSLFGLHVHSCTHWLRSRNSPLPPAFGLTNEGAIGLPR